MTIASAITEFRNLYIDPVLNPLGIAASDYRSDGTDESEGSPRHFAKSARNVNTYWRHYRDNPLIRSAVNEIVNAIISIPLIADKYDRDSQSWVPLAMDDPLSQLLAFPSQSVSPAIYQQAWVTQLIVTANGYQYKQRGRLNQIREFTIADSRFMYPVPGTNTMLDGFRWTDKYATGTGESAIADLMAHQFESKKYETRDIVFTCMNPDPAYPLMGLSPIASALNDIDLDESITRFTTSLMNRGAVHDWALITKARTNESEMRRMVRRWLRRSGPDNAGGLVVVDGTEADLKQLGMSIGPRDMALMELRKFVEARMLMVLNVPPIVVGSVIGMENATYSNYDSARKALHEENTDPLLTRICSALEWSFRDEFPEHRGSMIRVRADLSHVWALLDNVDKRDRLALAKMNAAAMTQAEGRKAMDLAPLKDVPDFFMTPANYVPQTIDQIGKTGPVSNGATATAPDQKQVLALRKAIADGDKIGVLRHLSAHAQHYGFDTITGDMIAFDTILRDEKSSPAETNRAKAHRLLSNVTETAMLRGVKEL